MQACNPFHLWAASLARPLSALPSVHFKVMLHTPLGRTALLLWVALDDASCLFCLAECLC